MRLANVHWNILKACTGSYLCRSILSTTARTISTDRMTWNIAKFMPYLLSLPSARRLARSWQSEAGIGTPVYVGMEARVRGRDFARSVLLWTGSVKGQEELAPRHLALQRCVLGTNLSPILSRARTPLGNDLIQV